MWLKLVKQLSTSISASASQPHLFPRRRSIGLEYHAFVIERNEMRYRGIWNVDVDSKLGMSLESADDAIFISIYKGYFSGSFY